MLTGIKITNIRNIKQSHLTFSKNINIFVGQNGSGKTSLLEGVYLLSRSRSFRTQSTSKVRSKGESSLVVYGLVEDEYSKNSIAIQKSKTDTQIRINGKDEKKTSVLSSYLKVHLIRPESQALLERGASIRRTFVDWGLFHVKHRFLEDSKKYNHTLKQRNKLLKQQKTATLSIWNESLAEYGTIVDKERSGYIDALAKELEETTRSLLGGIDIQLSYSKGWPDGETLLESLSNTLKRDLFKGYTTAGPHRSDLVLKVNGVLVQDFLSRGQMKLAVLALYLAQVKISNQASKQDVCVLIDDLSAELDEANLNKALKYLSEIGAQVLITTTNLEPFKNWLALTNTKLFHVEQGVIKEGV